MSLGTSTWYVFGYQYLVCLWAPVPGMSLGTSTWYVFRYQYLVCLEVPVPGMSLGSVDVSLAGGLARPVHWSINLFIRKSCQILKQQM